MTPKAKPKYSDTESVAELEKIINNGLYRREEKEHERDQWGCFQADNSSFREQLNYPFLDILLQNHPQRSILREVTSQPPWSWPNNKIFAVALSHDVDAIKNPGNSNAPDHFFSNFYSYVELEEKCGFCSAFYVVALPYPDRINPDYDISQEPLKSILPDLTARGWEVGLHFSYGSHLDGNKIRREKERLEEVLGQQVFGGRCHFLPFEVEKTRQTLLEMMGEKTGVRVVIMRQSCALSPEKKAGRLYEMAIDEALCKGDSCGCARMCTRVFKCPGLNWDEQAQTTRLDEVICTGCGVCASICPAGAIQAISA